MQEKTTNNTIGCCCKKLVKKELGLHQKLSKVTGMTIDFTCAQKKIQSCSKYDNYLTDLKLLRIQGSSRREKSPFLIETFQKNYKRLLCLFFQRGKNLPSPLKRKTESASSFH